MKITLLSAVDAGPSKEPPREIVYLPEGEHRITPQTHPQGVWIKVPPERGHMIAATLQGELERLNAASVKPFLDFEHSRKAPASGHPQGFRYEPGRGIILAVDWSGSGRRALMDRDVEYFSPECYIDQDGIPNGLPEKGPIGGLVQNPAFRTMQRIAAGQSGDEDEDEGDPMDRLAATLAEEAAQGGTQLYQMYTDGLEAGTPHERLAAAIAEEAAKQPAVRDYQSMTDEELEALSPYDRVAAAISDEDIATARAELDRIAASFVESRRARNTEAALVMAAEEYPDVYRRAYVVGA